MTIKIRLTTPLKDGRPAAQILIGNKALPKVALEEFNAAVRTSLSSQAEVECLDIADPLPDNLTPKLVADSQVVQPPPPPGIHDNNPYNFAEWACQEPWVPREGHDDALHSHWSAKRISGVIKLRLEAVTPILVPAGSTEDTKNSNAPGKTQANPQTFFKCHDSTGQERFTIPGSSLRGVLRTLFETWTNSRLSLVNEEQYHLPIPYRRRSATAWVIAACNLDGSRTARQCEVKFLRQTPRGWTERTRQGQEGPCTLPAGQPAIVHALGTPLDPNNTSNWQATPLRTNLLWTPDYNRTPKGGGNYDWHRWTHLAVKVSAQRATLRADDIRRYQRNVLHHESYHKHPSHVRKIRDAAPGHAPGKDFYNDIDNEDLDRRRADLVRLDVGALVFGIPDPANPSTLSCFGKNVNFLWPSRWSPADLAGNFFPRSTKSLQLRGADLGEAVFGFAGTGADGSHPFRSRVRIGMFWASDLPSPRQMAATPIGPLLSPSGVKLKARPLYLPPVPASGSSQNFDEATRFRGRKFYWHQRTQDGAVAPQHRGADGAEGVFWLCPLEAGAVFDGEIHFDNLTSVEFGALLVTLDPALYFQAHSDAAACGYKVGKAKARGLGSVKPTITSIRLRRSFGDAYKDLTAQVLTDSSAASCAAVQDFSGWLDLYAAQLGLTCGRDLPFVQDLARLLRLPDSPVTKAYAPNPQDYGWMPAFYNPGHPIDAAAKGDPTPPRKRPSAMRRARDS